MVKIEYIGKFMPKGIYEVPDKKVEGLMATGDYKMPGVPIKSKVTTKIVEKVTIKE